MADQVQLTDLDVIARYSIAVRSASADRDELIEALRGDLAWLERGRARTAPPAVVEDDYEQAPPSPPARTPARATTRPSTRKVAVKKAASRRTAR